MAGDAGGAVFSRTATCGRLARVGLGRGVGAALPSVLTGPENKPDGKPSVSTLSAGAVSTDAFSTTGKVLRVLFGEFLSGVKIVRFSGAMVRRGDDRTGEVRIVGCIWADSGLLLPSMTCVEHILSDARSANNVPKSHIVKS